VTLRWTRLQRLVGADRGDGFAPGVRATVIGIGATDPRAQQSPGELRQVEVTVAEDGRCAPSYSGYDAERMICAGDPGPDENTPEHSRP